jgi:hypothetical protein
MTHIINTITVSMPAWLEKYIHVFGNASDPHFKNRLFIITQNFLDWMGYKGKDTSIKQFNFSKVRYTIRRNRLHSSFSYRVPECSERG